MTTQKQIKQAFWQTFFIESRLTEYKGKTQNDLPVDIRMAFVDFVDSLSRDKVISEKLASRVTL